MDIEQALGDRCPTTGSCLADHVRLQAPARPAQRPHPVSPGGRVAVAVAPHHAVDKINGIMGR